MDTQKMERKLIAEALLEMAVDRSTTTFIESADKELVAAAKKMNIVIPSPDLAIIKTVYAEVDKPNKNGVILPKKAAIAGLPTLIGKQINWEHDGAGRVCGYTIDAKLNDKDEIEIVGVIFKSLFPEEMADVKTKFEEKKLAVSFEIWSTNPETKEAVTHLVAGGQYISIDPIIYHGTGLLANHKPACPKAIVYKLLANTEIENAEKIVDKIFESDLIFASLAVPEPKCNNCKDCKCGGDKVEDEKKEAIVEIKIEDPKPEIKAEEIVPVEKPAEEKTETEEPKTETKVAEIPAAVETKVEDAPKVDETPKAEEENKVEAPVEPAKEESAVEKPAKEKVEVKPEEVKKADEVIEQPIAPVSVIRVIREESAVSVYTPDEKGSRESRKGKTKTTREFSDGTNEITEQEFEVVDTYTQAQLDEAVTAAKATKDAEIATLKAEFETKLTEIKPKELEPIKAEEIVKDEPKDEKKEVAMEVGNVIIAGEYESETKVRAKKIDEIIAQKHQR